MLINAICIVFLLVSLLIKPSIGGGIVPSDTVEIYKKLRFENRIVQKSLLYQNLFSAYFSGGKFKLARLAIDSSLGLISQYDSLSDLVANAMILNSTLLAKTGDLKGSARIQKHYHVYSKSDSIRVKATIAWVDNLARQSYTDTALHLLEEIKSSPYLIESPYLRVKFYLLEALLQDNKSQYKVAAKLYFKALDLAIKENDLPMLARCYNNIGAMYISANQSTTALKYLMIADSLYQLLGDDLSILNAHNNIALVYKNLKNYHLAKKFYEKIIAKSREVGDKVSLAIAYFNLGNVLEALQQIDSAEVKYRASLDLSLSIGLGVGSMYNSYGLGKTAMNKKQYEKAINFFKVSFDEAQKIPDYSIATECADSMAACWARLGEFEKAYEWMVAARKCKELLSKNNELQTIEKLRADYEQSQVKLENNLLRTKNEQTFNRLKYQQYLIVGSLISGLLFMILLFVQYRSYLRVKRLNEELKVQKDKTDDQNIRLEALNADLEDQKQNIWLKSTELEKALGLKDKMISIISHDLRAPLVSLSQLVKFAIAGDITPAEFVKMTTQLQDQVENNLSLIDNLVIWSRTGIQGRPEECITIPLKQLLKHNIGLYQTIIQDKQLSISNDLPESVNVFMEPEAVSMIIRNLLSNAIKFSQTGGAIQILAALKPGFLELKVTDQGIGIDPSRLETLFKRTQGSSRGTGNEHGFGIGLVFIHELLISCRGSIQVESLLGQGSTFTVNIPA
jgi:two-component system, sensor histidine kinase and response regulator